MIRGKLKGSVQISFLATGASFGAGALNGIIFARILGPVERGELAVIVLWPTLLIALGAVGLPEAVTYRLAQRERQVGEVAGSALMLSGIQATLTTIAGVGVVTLVVALTDIPATPALLNVLAIPCGILGATGMGALNGLRRPYQFQLIRTLPTIVTLMATLTILEVGQLTVMTATIAYISGMLSMLLVSAVFFFRAARMHGPLRPTRAATRDLFRFGLKSYASSIPTQLNYRLDQLLISLILAPVYLGYYVVAVTFTNLTMMVGTSVQVVALPAVAHARSARERLAQSQTLLRTVAFVTAVVTIPLIVVLPELIDLLFGARFGPAATAGRILLVGAVALSIRSTLDGMLKGVGRPLAVGAAEGLALIATAVLLPPFLHWFKIEGAAVVSSLAYTISAIVMVKQLAQALDVPVRTLALSPRAAAEEPPARHPNSDGAERPERSVSAHEGTRGR
jgi:O-antigen/teichoic acid export membrane protein